MFQKYQTNDLKQIVDENKMYYYFLNVCDDVAEAEMIFLLSFFFYSTSSTIQYSYTMNHVVANTFSDSSCFGDFVLNVQIKLLRTQIRDDREYSFRMKKNQ